MPKIKTHRGAAKRLNLTGTGKITRSKANKGHLLTGKKQSRIRRLKKSALAPKTLINKLKKLLPYQI